MKLNIGCGNRTKKGFIGIDKYPCKGADIIADLDKKLPLGDNNFDEIWMDNVIEHLRDISETMKEIHRISVPGALITIVTPHFASVTSWRDPTHLHHLSYFSMDHFEKESVRHYTGGGYKVIRKKLTFRGGLSGYFARFIFKRSPKKYEAKWCYIFRPGTLTFQLRIVKKQSPETSHS